MYKETTTVTVSVHTGHWHPKVRRMSIPGCKQYAFHGSSLAESPYSL